MKTQTSKPNEPQTNSTQMPNRKKPARRISDLAKSEIEDVVDAMEQSRVAKQFSGFMDFVREQGVVGLAIGIVIGTQVKTVVDALVSGFINPMVALAMPGSGDLSDKVFTVHRAGHTPQQFHWGMFVATVISFVIVAMVIYFGVKALRLDKLDKKKES